jgi:hypothetical protein
MDTVCLNILPNMNCLQLYLIMFKIFAITVSFLFSLLSATVLQSEKNIKLNYTHTGVMVRL